MKYLVYKENGKVSSISPVPLYNNEDFEATIEVDELPKITDNQEYDIVNGKLVIVDKSTETLEKEKQEKLKQDLANIDAETQAKFTFFEFDGEKFSLSQNAQFNWGQLMSLKLAGWFGNSQSITTHQDKEYTLTSENVDSFMQTYASAKMTILTEGRKKKEELLK